jgi:small subunit ribosomal protein S21
MLRLNLPPNWKAGESRLAEVHIQDGETLESALRLFKRKVQREDIIKEIKRHSFYLKPGEQKRTKEALARKRIAKNAPATPSSNLTPVRPLPLVAAQ